MSYRRDTIALMAAVLAANRDPGYEMFGPDGVITEAEEIWRATGIPEHVRDKQAPRGKPF